ncbi:MAG: Sec-independent protein translocase subunit TatA [Actinomycetota bacterium]|nr:Sec-independent protein translocase subunit TatA [Actinomycetota bacterium]
MGWESPSHWVIIAILVIALFGYKKLPDAARAIGRSLRVFKTEVKGMSEDDKAREAAKDPSRDNRTDSAGAAAVAAVAAPVAPSPQPVPAARVSPDPMSPDPMSPDPMSPDSVRVVEPAPAPARSPVPEPESVRASGDKSGPGD